MKHIAHITQTESSWPAAKAGPRSLVSGLWAVAQVRNSVMCAYVRADAALLFGGYVRHVR